MAQYTLMTPGPVPAPQKVLEILGLPMEHHRTPEFVTVLGRTLQNLKKFFQTEQDVFIHTSTGSGAMESAIVNVLSPGDAVLCVVTGKFGERWADMAEAYGANVTRLEVPWGRVVDIRAIESHLHAHPETKAVLTQGCETSTGVLHPIREIAKLTAQSHALLLVDGITALGAMPMPMDEWGIDVLIGGSQKAFMLPTGLSFISLSAKAWRAAETATMPRFYFDLRRERDANRGGESYFSSAVTHVRALDWVLQSCLEIGIDKLYRRIQGLSLATQEAVRIMGLEIFSEVPSPSVTAIAVPDGIDGQKLRGNIEKIDHVVMMGGQDQLKGKILRMGNMGAISDRDLVHTLRSIAAGLNRAQANPDHHISEAKIDEACARALEILSSSPELFATPATTEVSL